MKLGVRKIPEPMTVPTSTVVASTSPNFLGRSFVATARILALYCCEFFLKTIDIFYHG
jgi:hypothetical protein